MARDLIPPSSPAGRPAPDGAPRLIELPPEPPRSPAQPSQRPAPPPSEFRNRFGFLMGGLGGVFVAAAALVAVVAFTGKSAQDAGLHENWSKWQPTDTSVDGGAAQIAAKVGAEYRHPNGQQLVLVTGRQLPLPIALRPATGNISVLEETGVIYHLNGLGANNSINVGKSSKARLRVLQREALELSLYTFRYLPDVKMVVTLLPPPPPEEAPAEQSAQSAQSTQPANGALPVPTPAPAATQRTAIFYRPGDLKPQLQVPLGVTVPAKAPTADTLTAAELRTIETLTLSNVFIASNPEPGNLLVLDRPTQQP
jgi:hypothetical protein